MFPTPNIQSSNISWLYHALADSWIHLGLPDDTRETIERGAFYTTVVRPGLRVISLNMNYCSAENFWLFINSTDPLEQLQWVRAFFQENLSAYSSRVSDDQLVTIRRRSWRKSSYYWTYTSESMSSIIQLEFSQDCQPVKCTDI